MTGERAALLYFLQAQRDSVVAIVDGLDEQQARRSVVPSGWSPFDLIGHLQGAEWFWFQHAFGQAVDPPADRPTGRGVLAGYRAQCAASDRVIAASDLGRSVTADIVGDVMDDVHDLRDVVLHMIEETARHAGHLDLARELIDGRVGLGPR